MELRQMKYFVAVAEELHFGHAAEREHVTPAALSQQVQRLERELGVQLIDRTTRRVQLTGAGRLFLEDVRVALARVQRAAETARRAGNGHVGELVVGYPMTGRGKRASAIMRAFRERYPGVLLTSMPSRTADLVEELRHEQIDVAFLHHSIGQDAQLDSRVISRKPYVLAIPAGHPLARQHEISVEQLIGERFLFFERGLSPHHYDQLMDELSERIGTHLRIVEEASAVSDLIDGVEAGVGLGLIMASATRGMVTSNVVLRAFRPPSPTLVHTIAWRTADSNPALWAFLRLVAESAGYDDDSPAESDTATTAPTNGHRASAGTPRSDERPVSGGLIQPLV